MPNKTALRVIEIDWKDIRKLAEKKINDFDLGVLVGTAFVMADYEHNTYRLKPKDGFASVELVAMPNTPAAGKNGVWRGHQVAYAVNAARELSNTPGGDMTPELLAEAAIKLARGARLKLRCLTAPRWRSSAWALF